MPALPPPLPLPGARRPSGFNPARGRRGLTRPTASAEDDGEEERYDGRKRRDAGRVVLCDDADGLDPSGGDGGVDGFVRATKTAAAIINNTNNNNNNNNNSSLNHNSRTRNNNNTGYGITGAAGGPDGMGYVDEAMRNAPRGPRGWHPNRRGRNNPPPHHHHHHHNNNNNNNNPGNPSSSPPPPQTRMRDQKNYMDTPTAMPSSSSSSSDRPLGNGTPAAESSRPWPTQQR